MNRSVLRRAVATSLAAVTALVTLTPLASAATDAVEAVPSVKIAKVSSLYGGGGMVLVSLDVRCTAGGESGGSYVGVRISQVGGPFGTVFGEAASQATCTGAKETVQVAVAGYAPFELGEAFASAEIQVCEFECQSGEDARTVKVTPGVDEIRRYRSPDLTYQLPRTAELQAGGAGAVVLVPYTCSPGVIGGFEAVLAQSSPDGYTSAAGDSSQLTCTDSNRTGVLAFHATGSGWSPGSAFLFVDGYVCPSELEACGVGKTYRSIKLV